MMDSVMFEVFVMNGIEEKGLYEYLSIYMSSLIVTQILPNKIM
jgi:hypothetical protein